jgi:hypothetical protein
MSIFHGKLKNVTIMITIENFYREWKRWCEQLERKRKKEKHEKE